MTINRRDFLKLSTLITTSSVLRLGLQLYPARLSTDPNAKNILIILFDALAADNINFHGYSRETMPNLTSLLDRATVYHNHYASANFTTPGTASLLTGRHPWEHGALKLGYSVKSELSNKNIFSFFDDYFTWAYTHNHFADIFLSQFNQSISQHEYYKNLFLKLELIQSSQWFTDLMDNDLDAALLLKTRLEDKSLDGFLYSLLFPSFLGKDKNNYPPEILDRFPRGIPDVDRRGPFILEDSIDWTLQQCVSLPQPFLGYLHFYPPHYPYNTREEFIDSFRYDGYRPPEKPPHPVVIPLEPNTEEETLDMRRDYDEFILYADAEFNRLFSTLEQQGVLENTLLIFTSDHGEMFERKVRGHSEPYLFEPLVKVPLIIFEPGQTERRDIHDLTSCIDLLPTMLYFAGHDIPAELPGKILPAFNPEPIDPHRTIFAMDAQYDPKDNHLTMATLMMRRGDLKVIRYSNYAEAYRYYGRTDLLDAMQNKDPVYFEVFDLESDPEELNNLALSPSPEIALLIDELENFYRDNVEYPQ
jgi:arylsulfatase A-like enzyme